MKFKIILSIFLIIGLGGSVAHAQGNLPGSYSRLMCQNFGISLPPTPEFSGDRALMTAAILQKLTIWVRPADNSRVYVSHCRRYRHGCENEISALVNYIFDVAIRNGFDPWLLAGIAWHESRFNTFAESDQRAFGLLQILRRSPWSRGLSFIHQRRFRERCYHELGSCQRPIVERSVFWLRRSIEHCGSISGGLRMYNSGRCDGPRRYPRSVFAAQQDILERAKNIVENNFVDPSIPHDGPVFVAENRHICSVNANRLCSQPTPEQYWCSAQSSICSSYRMPCECNN